MFTKQCLVSTHAAGAPPTLGVAFCKEGGFLLRLRQKLQGLGIFLEDLLKQLDILVFFFAISNDGSTVLNASFLVEMHCSGGFLKSNYCILQ